MARPSVHNGSTYMILHAIGNEPDGIHFRDLWDRPEFKHKFRVIKNLTARISAVSDGRHKLIYSSSTVRYMSPTNNQYYNISIFKLTEKGQQWLETHTMMQDGTIANVDNDLPTEVFGDPKVIDFEPEHFQLDTHPTNPLFTALNQMRVPPCRSVLKQTKP